LIVSGGAKFDGLVADEQPRFPIVAILRVHPMKFREQHLEQMHEDIDAGSSAMERMSATSRGMRVTTLCTGPSHATCNHRRWHSADRAAPRRRDERGVEPAQGKLAREDGRMIEGDVADRSHK
jgi:hypothetical protein